MILLFLTFLLIDAIMGNNQNILSDWEVFGYALLTVILTAASFAGIMKENKELKILLDLEE